MTICFCKTKQRKLQWLPWVILPVYYIITVSQHLRFSNLITGKIHSPFGVIILSDSMSVIGWMSAIILILWILLQTFKGKHTAFYLMLWLAWWLFTVPALALLLYHPNELLHYPQYAVLAMLLSWSLDPDGSCHPLGRILFWSALLGLIDEMNQYFFICARYGDYLDFNDCLFNIFGAAGGLLLRYGFQKVPPSRPRAAGPAISLLLKNAEIKIFFFIAMLCSVLLLGGFVRLGAKQDIPPGGVVRDQGTCILYLERKPSITGSWIPRPGGGQYYVLTPGQGIMALLLAGYLFALLPEGLKILIKRRSLEKKIQKTEN